MTLIFWTTALVLGFLIYILRLVAKKEVEMKNVISWLILGILTLPLIWFPGILEFFSKTLSVEVPTNLLFFLGICFLIYLNFSLTRIVSKQSVQIRQLSQKIAIEKKQLWLPEGQSSIGYLLFASPLLIASVTLRGKKQESEKS